MPVDKINKTKHYKQDETMTSNTSHIMKITIFDGQTKPREINLNSFNKRVITFGRSESNDIILDSFLVSRIHGCFVIQNRSCIIEDLGSTNGLIFDGKTDGSRILEKSKVLQDGDTIRIDDGIKSTKRSVLIVFSRSSMGNVWNTFPVDSINNISIGRDDVCEIQLNHISVSRVHAKVFRIDSKFYIYDNNSTNGIVVNGEIVKGRRRLCEKDLILITNSKLVFSNDKIIFCCFKEGMNIEAINIRKIVRDKHAKGQLKNKVICNDVSLTINPCELIAVVGGSGDGKSTIMNCISGYNEPTNGAVYVNGINLYENFGVLKNIIGYVPQSDIVYDNLSILDMLNYAAKLRLPKDISKSERINIVEDVINIVELTANKNTLIKKLSGGQRKRASIAVELLSDPNLFFLDEPASGLDPGTERNLMMTLKKMASNGKTIMLVTHSTLNLHICDKIVFMGRGGNLCFYGSYKEALSFFEVDDIVDVYNMISVDAEIWREKYKIKVLGGKEGEKLESIPRHLNSNRMSAKFKKNNRGQLFVLCMRYLHILSNDRQRFLLVLLQAPVLALLISVVANGKQFEQFEITKSLLFALSCSAFWIGTLNSIQEICKERNIFKREYMTGLHLHSYILSKLIILGLLCAIQSIMVVTVFAALVGLPSEGVLLLPYLEMLITFFFTALSATAMGIFVSSLFKNADRAMTVAPLLLMPQILFSGLIFNLDGVVEIISWIAVCRWSMEGLGTSANLNNLPLKLQEQGIDLIHEAEDFYKFTSEHIIFAWSILFLFVIIFSIIAGLALRNVKKDKN